MRRAVGSVTVPGVLLAVIAATDAPATDLTPEIIAHLEKDPYVYISSTRKSGDLGRAAEIWFSWEGSTVLIGTSTGSYRVRRIKAGRAAARIWVANTQGPWFGATGELVDGAAEQERMLTAFAKKYGDSFREEWQAKFREGFAKGTRVLVRYTPTGAMGRGPQGLPAAK